MSSLMCRAIRMGRSSQVLLGRAQRLSGDDAVRPGGPGWEYPQPHSGEGASRTISLGLAGGLADVLADLPQRPRRLGNHRRTELEVVNLARPDPHLGRHSGRREYAGRRAGVM
jgi:hypothetical protein